MNRRLDGRFAPPAAGAQATLRPGCAVVLVDISAGGALVQATRPLRPGARVHLQVVTPSRRYAIAAQVLRCMVWALDPVDGVTYRGGLKFDHRIDWGWAEPTRSGHQLPEQVGSGAAERGHQLPGRASRQVAQDARGAK